MERFLIMKENEVLCELEVAGPMALQDNVDRAKDEMMIMTKRNKNPDVTFYLLEVIAKSVKHQNNGMYYIDPVDD